MGSGSRVLGKTASFQKLDGFFGKALSSDH